MCNKSPATSGPYTIIYFEHSCSLKNATCIVENLAFLFIGCVHIDCMLFMCMICILLKIYKLKGVQVIFDIGLTKGHYIKILSKLYYFNLLQYFKISEIKQS